MPIADIDEVAPAIPYADEAALDAESLAVFAKTRAMLGVVPNAARTYAHRPDIARLIEAMYDTIVRSDRSGLDTHLKAKLGVICSSVNGCSYCTSHQCSLTQGVTEAERARTGINADDLIALISGRDEGRDEVERLCFEFARTASVDPGGVSVDLLECLRQRLTSAQVVELGCVVAMWKFFNTMHDSLHIPGEGVMARFADMIPAGRAEAAARTPAVVG